MTDTCRCVNTTQAARLALAGEAIPLCPEHDEQPAAVGLNSQALADSIASTFGATSADPSTPLDAA